MKFGMSHLVLICTLVISSGSAAAQSTQPGTRFDDQPVLSQAAGNEGAVSSPTTAPAAAQLMPGQFAPPKFDWARVAAALALVIGIIFAMKYIARRWLGVSSAMGAGKVIRVLGRTTTGPRQQVVMLQVGNRIVVAADNAGQLSTLCQVTEADEVASLLGQLQVDDGSARAGGFRKWLKKADEDFAADELENQPIASGAVGVSMTATDIDPALDEVRGEIAGLMDKVRSMARQYRKQ